MDEEEILEENYKIGKMIFNDLKKIFDKEIRRLKSLKRVITYKKDGEVIESIIQKFEKSNKQCIQLSWRFKELELQAVMPRKINKKYWIY